MAGLTRISPLVLPIKGQGETIIKEPDPQVELQWPSALPLPQLEDFEEMFRAGVLRSEIPVGVATQRLRTKAAPRPFRMRWRLTTSQVAILESFYVTTLGHGALAWRWTHPRTNVSMLFRFAGPTESSPVGYDTWDVSAEVEGVPG